MFDDGSDYYIDCHAMGTGGKRRNNAFNGGEESDDPDNDCDDYGYGYGMRDLVQDDYDNDDDHRAYEEDGRASPPLWTRERERMDMGMGMGMGSINPIVAHREAVKLARQSADAPKPAAAYRADDADDADDAATDPWEMVAAARQESAEELAADSVSRDRKVAAKWNAAVAAKGKEAKGKAGKGKAARPNKRAKPSPGDA